MVQQFRKNSCFPKDNWRPLSCFSSISSVQARFSSNVAFFLVMESPANPQSRAQLVEVSDGIGLPPAWVMSPYCGNELHFLTKRDEKDRFSQWCNEEYPLSISWISYPHAPNLPSFSPNRTPARRPHLAIPLPCHYYSNHQGIPQ